MNNLLNFLISILTVFYIIENYNCEDYLKIKVEDIVIEYVNETYFDVDTLDISVNYQSKDRSSVGMRIDVIEDLPKDMSLKLKVWGYAFGNYNIPTGVDMDINVCNNKLNDFLFKTITAQMGMGQTCPPEKGKYENKDFDPEIGGFPLKFLPGFRLLIESESYSQDIRLMRVLAYVQVV